MAEEERIIWEGHPSPVLNLWTFVLCALTFWLVVPVFVAGWRWLVLRCHVYKVTNERLILTTGVLSKRVEEVELYRVKDSRLEQPFVLRLFRLGNVVLTTSDRSHPVFVIEAIPGADVLREELRGCVEKLRDEKRVREVDFD